MPDMELHGQAMLDYMNGNENALCILRRDDGVAYPPIYARQFFYHVGIVQNLDGLARFLKHLDGLMTEDGQLITDSIDPRNSEDESYRKYTQKKIAKGCYLGERTLRFEYKNQTGDWFEWMHIDPETLGQYVDAAGYSMENLGRDGKRYLVSIKKR